MPLGRIEGASPLPVGGGQPNILLDIGKRWLAMQNAAQGGPPKVGTTPPADPQADAAMAQVLGLAGAPPAQAGLEGVAQPPPGMAPPGMAVPPMHPPSPMPMPPQAALQARPPIPIPMSKPRPPTVMAGSY